MSNKKRIVTIGGGTGQMAVLTGLKAYADVVDIAAIVAMADDGGSTGRLRDELGVLPPGDIRKCLVALADDAPVLRALFEYRFNGGGMAGHSFGNLLLAALEKVTGSLPAAIEEASRILRVRGRVLPVTTDNTRIHIDTKTERQVVGEHHLDNKHFVRTEGVHATHLTHSPTINPHARDALLAADCIVIGPGDVYGSILPCLHVGGMREALAASTHARKVLIVNATNKKGLTDGWGASDYLACVEREVGAGTVTHCIANTTPAPQQLVEKYVHEEGAGVLVACDTLPITCTPIYTHLLKTYPADAHEHFIRHDEQLLATEIMRICST
jgi:uncharacterized cofD-like protein